VLQGKLLQVHQASICDITPSQVQVLQGKLLQLQQAAIGNIGACQVNG